MTILGRARASDYWTSCGALQLLSARRRPGCSWQAPGWGLPPSCCLRPKQQIVKPCLFGHHEARCRGILSLLPSSVVTDKTPASYVASRARQSVPLAEYEANIRTIVERLRKLQVPSIVLITPPPISEPHRIAHAAKVRTAAQGAAGAAVRIANTAPSCLGSMQAGSASFTETVWLLLAALLQSPTVHSAHSTRSLSFSLRLCSNLASSWSSRSEPMK